MIHTFEIKETPKTKPLIDSLRKLTYVKHLGADDRKMPTEKEMIARIKKSEKSKSIPLDKAIQISAQWIKKHKTSK